MSAGERELIATYVSSLNNCKYCSTVHGAIAKHHLHNADVVQQVKTNPETAPISNKLKALLKIAGRVQLSGKEVSESHVEAARKEGATDIEIHDTVLIAALFCLYNRYVDGLATALPEKSEYFDTLAERLVNHGYTRLPQGYDHLKKQE